MFIIIIIFILLIPLNSFLKRFTFFIFKKKKLFVFFDHYEFDKSKITYTIMGSGNKNTMSLIKDIENHRINFYYINISYYSYDDVINLCEKYKINHTSDVYNKPLVFGENKFIGGSFELYQEILNY